MNHRAWLKRFLLVGLPLGILMAIWAVGRYSSAFEGRRWLRERGQQAVRMDIEYSFSSPVSSEVPQLISVDEPEVIQSMLGRLNCVGSLNDANQYIPADGDYGAIYQITLSYPGGRKEFLTLYPADTYHDLVHYHSASDDRMEPKVVGVAHVSGRAAYSFRLAFDALWASSGRRIRERRRDPVESPRSFVGR